jgi:quinol monooxygenase YgiN
MSRKVHTDGPKAVGLKEVTMVKFGILATLEAKIGKEHEVAAFLKSALPLVEAEPGTVSWFAIRVSSTTFAIFDAFNDEAGRDAHLAGEVAKALIAEAPELFSQPPKIGNVDVLAAKLG